MANKEIRLPIPAAIAVSALFLGLGAGSWLSHAQERTTSPQDGRWVMHSVVGNVKMDTYLYSEVTGEIWLLDGVQRVLVREKAKK